MRTPLLYRRSALRAPLAVALALLVSGGCDRTKSGEERMREHEEAGIEAGAAQILAQEQARAKADAEAAAEEIVEAMQRNAEAKRALEAELRADPLGADGPADDGSAPAAAKSPATASAGAFARYNPVLLSETPAKSSISPGEYLCKISKEYKLRPCTVRTDPKGHTMLTIPQALIALEGVIYDEGDVVHFDGWQTEERPFGCFSCAPRCSVDPSSCMCDELPPAASAHCMAQPITFELKRKGGGWRGMMDYTTYSSRYEGEVPARRVTGYETEVDSFVVELQPAR